MKPILPLLAAALAVASPAVAQDPGAPLALHTYRTFGVEESMAAYVVSFDPRDPGLDLLLAFAHGERRSPTKQTTSAIAEHYEADPEHDVLVALNASFWGRGNDTVGVLGNDGTLIQFPDGNPTRPAFAWTTDNRPLASLPLDVTERALILPGGQELTIDLLDEDPQQDKLVLYSPQWGPAVEATSGTLVLLGAVNHPQSPGKDMTGRVERVVALGPDGPEVALGEGQSAVLAVGEQEAGLKALKAGDAVTWRLDLSDPRMRDAEMLVEGYGYLVKDGQPNRAAWEGVPPSFSGRHPRSIVAWNDERVFLVAVDGRQPGYSVGHSFEEMAKFLTETLGATEAVNLDGGGSTALWVDGAVVNRPSDKTGQRPVNNALLLVRRGAEETPAAEASLGPAPHRE